MKRRSFLRTTGSFTLGSIILNGVSVRAATLQAPFSCQDIEDRIFVMINLFGANDTLNTAVPVQQYDIYANARPNIRIAESGSNKYIQLDNTLPARQQTGLHPVLTPFKALYDAGKLNLVHGVGYLNSNRSHFKGDDLWNTAGDSTPANYSFSSGWAGELFEYRYPGVIGNPNSSMPDPPCVELGAVSSSLLFQTSNSNNASVLLGPNNISSYYNTLVAVGGPSPDSFPESDYGNELRFIAEVQQQSNSAAQRIQAVFNAGNNSSVTYPKTKIANQLKTVARLIKGGSKSSMYTLHQHGYDTHGAQAVGGSSHTGVHATLLTELSEAVKAFMDDIAILGFEDRVIITTHSEFGRTIDENAGLGTDHGGVSTMFIIGKGVKPGITGTPIDLTKVDNRGLTDLQYDYRSVWAAVLQDFMGHGPEAVQAARMSAYLGSKAPIISEEYKAPPSCYIGSIVLPVTLENFEVALLPTDNALITWQTSSESNCKEFEVQYSTDNLNWKEIARVPGSGNSSVFKQYKLEHNKPTTGINYYRLWQYDFDGSNRAYPPATLRVTATQANRGFEVKCYPNPAVYDFNIAITSDKAQKLVINIYDIQGHILHTKSATIQTGFSKINIPVTQLKNYKGQVILQIITNLGVEHTSRLIIQ